MRSQESARAPATLRAPAGGTSGDQAADLWLERRPIEDASETIAKVSSELAHVREKPLRRRQRTKRRLQRKHSSTNESKREERFEQTSSLVGAEESLPKSTGLNASSRASSSSSSQSQQTGASSIEAEVGSERAQEEDCFELRREQRLGRASLREDGRVLAEVIDKRSGEEERGSYSQLVRDCSTTQQTAPTTTTTTSDYYSQLSSSQNSTPIATNKQAKIDSRERGANQSASQLHRYSSKQLRARIVENPMQSLDETTGVEFGSRQSSLGEQMLDQMSGRLFESAPSGGSALRAPNASQTKRR